MHLIYSELGHFLGCSDLQKVFFFSQAKHFGPSALCGCGTQCEWQWQPWCTFCIRGIYQCNAVFMHSYLWNADHTNMSCKVNVVMMAGVKKKKE